MVVFAAVAAARLVTKDDLFDGDNTAPRRKGKGGAPAFRHYRRSRVTKAPRKRTFIMHMTKYPDAWISALASPTLSELGSGLQGFSLTITALHDVVPGDAAKTPGEVSAAVCSAPVAGQVSPPSSSSRKQSPFAAVSSAAVEIHRGGSFDKLLGDAAVEVAAAKAVPPTGQQQPVSGAFSDPDSAAAAPASAAPQQSLQLLGAGAQGEVYKAYRNGAAVAHKYPALAAGKDSDAVRSSLKSFEREVAILAMCEHPHVVTCLEVCRDGPRPYIVEEYASRGSIHDWLYSKDVGARAEGMAAIVTRALRENCSADCEALVDPLSTLILDTAQGSASAAAASLSWPDRSAGNALKYVAILKLLQDVASALSYLHSSAPQVVHRDLKPDNVLLTEEGVAKVADFGVATLLLQDQAQATPELFGTANYAAPEDLWGSADQVGTAADIYSLGCIAWECFAGECPWMGCSEYSIMFSVGQGTRQLALPATWPAGVRALLEKCLAFEASRRPTAAQVQDALQAELQQATRQLVVALRKH